MQWTKDKFLSYVAWSKITPPYGLGGLGIRDLSRVNEALLMKLLWKLASNNSALWIDLVKAKYLPRSELWLSKRTYKCSSCWRGIMAVRSTLLPLLTWRLGDGSVCTALAQPWFPGAVAAAEGNNSRRGLMVRDLVTADSNSWNVDSD